MKIMKKVMKKCKEVTKEECPMSKNCGTCMYCHDTYNNGWCDVEYFCAAVINAVKEEKAKSKNNNI